MSVTRMAVFIGIMCSVWMTSPSTANALEKFVGQSDRGSTRVRTCVDGKGGREFFYNDSSKHKVALEIGLSGDGLAEDDWLVEDDRFAAFFVYDGEPNPLPLFIGVWSKIGERKKKGDTDPVQETYQLAPSGDLTALSTSGDLTPLSTLGWEYLLKFINEEAGDACKNAPPSNVLSELSDLVKGTLVVDYNKVIDIDDDRKCDEDCREACVGPNCREAKVSLDVRAFMKGGEEPESGFSAKADWVKFKYKAKGYVVLNP
jgi:hypothetical protein